MTGNILQVRQLVKHFKTGGFFHNWRAPLIRAVDGVDFTVAGGEAFGLVGESGSGKTTIGRILLGLIKPTAGEVLLDGRDITGLTGHRKREMYRHIQGVFQDPLSSMNPRMTIAEIVAEPMLIHGPGTSAPAGDGRGPAARRQAVKLLAQAGLPASVAEKYPHQCSGGQRQRAALARALAVNPRFIVLDEPLSALDISCQAQMINLLKDCQENCGLGYLLISHDLRAVRCLCSRVAVMYLGRIMETGPAARVLSAPAHPYTRKLLAAMPTLEEKIKKPPAAEAGENPGMAKSLSMAGIYQGCRYRSQCPEATAVCAEKEPLLAETADGHAVACHLFP